MKPKPALKRTAIESEASGAGQAVAPLSKQQTSRPHRRGLSLVSNSEEILRESVGSGPYKTPARQSWFRKYDISGKVIEEGLCFVEDLPVFRWLYTYSAKGSKVQAVLLNASQCLLEKRLYDETEQLTRKIIFACDGTEERIDYEYDGVPNANGTSRIAEGLFSGA